MKYTIAKMFQILRHNRWVSILMIIEIALGMSVFTYSLNMFFSLSREKENQKNAWLRFLYRSHLANIAIRSVVRPSPHPGIRPESAFGCRR